MSPQNHVKESDLSFGADGRDLPTSGSRKPPPGSQDPNALLQYQEKKLEKLQDELEKMRKAFFRSLKKEEEMQE